MRTAPEGAAPRRSSLARLLRHAACCAAMLAFVAPGLARTLTVCVPQNPMPPLVYPDHESDAQALVRRAVELRGDTVRFVPTPWMRCRMGVQAGIYEAAMPMAETLQYRQHFAFPRKNGSLDINSRVGSLALSVVARASSKVDWNGRAFSGLTSPVMVLPAQQVARERLKELNIAEDPQVANTDLVLRMLAAGRRDAAVLPSGFAQEALAAEEFRGKLKLFHQPFTVVPVFLAFNRTFEQAQPEYVQFIWDTVALHNAPKRLQVSKLTASKSRS